VRRLQVIDSHTGGEPTRLVVAGGPELGGGTLAEQRTRLSGQHDWLRTALISEPRGSDVIVGAILCQPTDQRFTTGVVFFNNVGYLNMCGHGTIGVVKSLEYLGQISPGMHELETAVGTVTATLHEDGDVSFENVRSHRWRKDVAVTLQSGQTVTGDIAWGGNWFFLSSDHGAQVMASNIPQLSELTRAIRKALTSQDITGKDGQEIDHIELLGPSDQADARSFVLCPGGAYDRSPCGTGTSAKLACLAADGQLGEGDVWRQESIIGSIFTGSFRFRGDGVLPTIRGRAHITAETSIVLDEEDPFVYGIGVSACNPAAPLEND
jgi:4-hydroxyproline epimerase